MENEQDLVNQNQTAIEEYFDIVKSEYDNERNKKQSFENRAGLLLALIAAFCAFILENVKIVEVLSLMNSTVVFFGGIKIISGVVVYIGIAVTLINIFKVINVKKHDNFEVKDINEVLLVEPRIIALCKIIFTYRDIIIQHRTLNEERAKNFRNAVYGVSVMMLFTVLYLAIPC
ncbi:MAG: hypothetical protein ACLRLE_03860 [Turicibacter sp.]|uniref:hypothetical protein n=1 Tax=Turicibacter sp. GALT-G1 TaxID=2951140 RepID=UPI0021D4C861|nr:hypothetical protein [Turicibacter sp. GALT-G1]MCU7206560.1 hypothetical protein [Turicibacter sp. GALT-G1]